MDFESPKHSKTKREHGMKFLALFLIWRLLKSPLHGYYITQELKDMGVIPVKPSTIYLVLSKLEKGGLVKGSPGEAGKRMRKEYRVTAKGRAVFERIKKERVRGLLREFLKSLLS
jgi:DNA-binding PadR family transcriptional regulator